MTEKTTKNAASGGCSGHSLKMTHSVYPSENQNVTDVQEHLDAFEKYQWDFATQTENNVAIVLRMKHNIKLRELKKGAKALQKSHVLLQSKIVGYPPKFEQTTNFDIPITYIEKINDKDWKQFVHSEIHKPFFQSKHPSIKIIYLTGESLNELIITMHHSISDGVSLLVVASELLKSISQGGESSDTIRPRPAIEKIIMQKASIDISVSTNKELSNIQPLDEARTDSQTAHQMTGFLYRKISKELSAATVQAIKDHGCTVQSFFSAVLLQAISSAKATNIHANYVCPINIRPSLELSSKEIGPYIWVLSFPLAVNSSKEVWSLSHLIKRKIQNKLNDSQFWEKLYKEIKGEGDILTRSKWKTASPLVGVTNMGIIKEPIFDVFEVSDLYMATSLNKRLSHEDSIYLVVNSFNGQFFMNYIYPEGLISKNKIKEIADFVYKTLENYSLIESNV